MTLLFLSDIPWHSLHQRPQHLALRLARKRTVLWIEPATLGHSRTWVPERIGDNLYRVSVPLLPHNARNTSIKRAAWIAATLPGVLPFLTWCQRRIVRRALEQLHHSGAMLPAVVENFQLIRLVESLPVSGYCFDYIDDAFGFVEFPGYVHNLWAHTVRKSTVVTATTTQLAEKIQAVRPGQHVHIVRNGVEFSHFAREHKTDRPEDLPSSGKPIAGYVGSVYPWFDFDLLAQAAKTTPGVNFVIVGPQHPDVLSRVQELKKYPNVLFLGMKPYTIVPAYLHHFTIGIIPFLRNRLTEAVNPVKLYEYSAAGVPTVTTLFSDDLLQFHDVIHTATTPDAFLAAIPEALADAQNSLFIEKLRTFARENDWDARAAAINELLKPFAE